MPKVVIQDVNLNETTAWDGEATKLPPGEFSFEVADCMVKPPKKDGQYPQLEFDLIVTAGADTDQYNGSEKKHWLSLSPKAAGRVRNMLDACGVPVEADGGFDSDNFKGTAFIAEVYEEDYEKPDLTTGETRTVTNSRIRKERPISAGWGGGAASAPVQAPAQAAAPATPATPAAKAPARAAAPAAAAAAAKPAAPNLPRRPPVPPARRPAA